jgi:hypothetical protein
MRENRNQAWMISIYKDNEQGSLLEELLDLNILPEIVKRANLKDYSYKYFLDIFLYILFYIINKMI